MIVVSSPISGGGGRGTTLLLSLLPHFWRRRAQHDAIVLSSPISGGGGRGATRLLSPPPFLEEEGKAQSLSPPPFLDEEGGARRYCPPPFQEEEGAARRNRCLLPHFWRRRARRGAMLSPMRRVQQQHSNQLEGNNIPFIILLEMQGWIIL
jgi:hypothetical protein